MKDNFGFDNAEKRFRDAYGPYWYPMTMRFRWCMGQYPVRKEVNSIFDDVLGHH